MPVIPLLMILDFSSRDPLKVIKHKQREMSQQSSLPCCSSQGQHSSIFTDPRSNSRWAFS